MRGNINYLIFKSSESCVEYFLNEVTIINGFVKIQINESDIMEFNILGSTYYGISLCPELNNKNKFKKWLNGEFSLQKNGLNIGFNESANIIIKSNVKRHLIWTLKYYKM